MKLPNIKEMYKDLGTCHPSLSRGKVWCKTCGKELDVSSSNCIRNGWPKCCGYTMTIDSPEERMKDIDIPIAPSRAKNQR